MENKDWREMPIEEFEKWSVGKTFNQGSFQDFRVDRVENSTCYGVGYRAGYGREIAVQSRLLQRDGIYQYNEAEQLRERIRVLEEQNRILREGLEYYTGGVWGCSSCRAAGEFCYTDCSSDVIDDEFGYEKAQAALKAAEEVES